MVVISSLCHFGKEISMSEWSDLGFTEAQSETIDNMYLTSNIKGTEAFIRGIQFLSSYNNEGLSENILHAEHEVILIRVDRWDEVSYDDALILSSLGFSIDNEFGECWRYNASL
jgi:hypothetical protein